MRISIASLQRAAADGIFISLQRITGGTAGGSEITSGMDREKTLVKMAGSLLLVTVVFLAGVGWRLHRCRPRRP